MPIWAEAASKGAASYSWEGTLAQPPWSGGDAAHKTNLGIPKRPAGTSLTFHENRRMAALFLLDNIYPMGYTEAIPPRV